MKTLWMKLSRKLVICVDLDYGISGWTLAVMILHNGHVKYNMYNVVGVTGVWTMQRVMSFPKIINLQQARNVYIWQGTGKKEMHPVVDNLYDHNLFNRGLEDSIL